MIETASWVNGEVKDNEQLYSNQIAPTIAKILGLKLEGKTLK